MVKIKFIISYWFKSILSYHQAMISLSSLYLT